MKILHTVSSLETKSGGPSQSIYNMVSNSLREGFEIDILTFTPNSSEKIIGNDSFIHFIKKPKNTRFGFTSLLNKFYHSNAYDLYYCNGLWQYPCHAAAKFAQKKNKPYVIMPHGMLYPTALQKSKWIKKIALQLYQGQDLKNASAIHATCIQEMNYIRDLGYSNPIAVIPNSIKLSSTYSNIQIEKFKKQIGFIGRLVPIKNLELLINAWSISGKNYIDWELVIIGDGDTKYLTALKALINKLEIKNIRFTGFLTGYNKEIALKSLDYLVLPSKSENFGMVVPEALIRKIPVIASNGTPWEELNIYNAGWWIDCKLETLAETLIKAIHLPADEITQMGKNGECLIMNGYTTEAVAEKMIAFYDWLAGDGKKPEFVYG